MEQVSRKTGAAASLCVDHVGRWARLAALALILSACKSKAAKPDLNETFEDPNMDVASFVEKFESEDRAVFVHRKEIVEALGVQPGMGVADVGAGTGFFLEHFAEKVGPEGEVYAVEISERFLQHIEALAKAKKLGQVKVVHGSDTSVNLPPGSIDLALIVDTYHHFDQPLRVMTSIHAALRPGGRVAVIDFIRIEGVTKKEWVLEHVRAGEDVFSREIESVGFEKTTGPSLPFLKDVYLAIFEKRG